MKSTNKTYLPFLTILLLGIVYVFSFYDEVLKSPNDYIFSTTGDGIKNYFTYAYHIRHDSSYTEFEGMNFPYGENYLYTDCHPIVANAVKSLSSVSPFFESHSVGILNLLLILSILLTFPVIYLVLVNLKSNRWLSVVFSFCIAILAPQLFRLGGHFALSYSVAIPLSWLLILKCRQKPNWHWYLLLLANNLFWMLIHAYLGIIVSAFLISFAVVQFLLERRKSGEIRQFALLVLAIALPVILFYLHVMLTDTHTGRTDNPSGFFLYNAELDDVLIPPEEPLWPLFDKLSGGAIKLEWEARGYLGIFNSLFFVFLVLASLVSIFSKKARRLLSRFFDKKPLNISLIAAFVVLLFALAIPFRQIPSLVETFPIFKQFRATGRFVWPFYFVFTVFAATVFQKIILSWWRRDKKAMAAVAILVFVATYLMEGYHYHKPVSEDITSSANLFDEDQLPDDFQKAVSTIDPKKYQAIIAMPFYYQGSESYARPRQDAAVTKSMLLSYHTGIPNVCANLTRTSIEESKRIVQLVTPNYYEKKIADDFESTRPFLILKTGSEFSKYEEIILEKGKSIYEGGDFELLEIEYEKLFSDDRQKRLEAFREELPDLSRQNSFLVSDSSSLLYYDSFEKSKSDTAFRGTGSFVSVKKGKNTLAEFPPNTFEKGRDYDLSVWMYNGVPDALNLWFRLIIEEYDEQQDEWHSTTFFPVNAEVINGNWSLVEGTFSVQNPQSRVYIVTKGKENSKATLHVDELLIKDKGVEVYRLDETTNTLFYNNHRIEVP
ncbi:hypothetical protein [Halocola ammonii]